MISYGEAAANRLDAMKGAIGGVMAAKEIGRNLEQIFCCRASFLKCHPGQNIEWLRDYFYEMVRDGMCVGVFADGGLVSCTDAPGMPYMAGDVQEIGINTLHEYRGRGYASAACSKCIQKILEHGKTPMWSAAAGNTASRKLAERIGFVEFAEVIYITF